MRRWCSPKSRITATPLAGRLQQKRRPVACSRAATTSAGNPLGVGGQRRRRDHAHQLPVAGGRVLAGAQRRQAAVDGGRLGGRDARDRDDRAEPEALEDRQVEAARGLGEVGQRAGAGVAVGGGVGQRADAAGVEDDDRRPAAHAPPRGRARRSEPHDRGEDLLSTRAKSSGGAGRRRRPRRRRRRRAGTARRAPGPAIVPVPRTSSARWPWTRPDADAARAEARVARLGGLDSRSRRARRRSSALRGQRLGAREAPDRDRRAPGAHGGHERRLSGGLVPAAGRGEAHAGVGEVDARAALRRQGGRRVGRRRAVVAAAAGRQGAARAARRARAGGASAA